MNIRWAPCARAKGAGCPICAGQRLLSGYNDLQTRYPEIAKEWDEEKNGGLQPSQVMPGTVKLRLVEMRKES